MAAAPRRTVSVIGPEYSKLEQAWPPLRMALVQSWKWVPLIRGMLGLGNEGLTSINFSLGRMRALSEYVSVRIAK